MPGYSWGLRLYALSDPTILTAWERTPQSASRTLTLPSDPVVGGTVIVTASLWSQDVSGVPTQGINPTESMLSSNNGGTFAQDAIVLCTDGRAEASINTPGVAIFRHRIASIASLPYTVTFDIDPGGAGTGWWTWSLIYCSDIVEASPLIDSSIAHLPTAASPGTIPTEITFGTSTNTLSRAIAITAAHNGGHEGECDIADPTGYTAVAHNEENSAFLSGHSSYKLLSAAGDETPTMPITQSAETPTVTNCRGVLAIYRRVGGV
jgi:hypothetical protein